MEHILCIITVVTSVAAAPVVIHCHSMAQCSVNTATAFKLTAIMNFYPLTIVRTSNRIETLQRLLFLLGSIPGNFSTYTHIHDLLASHWQNPKMKRVLRFVFNTFFEGERERESSESMVEQFMVKFTHKTIHSRLLNDFYGSSREHGINWISKFLPWQFVVCMHAASTWSDSLTYAYMFVHIHSRLGFVAI